MTRLAWLLACVTLAACGSHRPQVPVSGVSGPNGGADATQYYDRKGRPHFEN